MVEEAAERAVRPQITTNQARKDIHYCWIRIRPGLGFGILCKRPSYQLVERTSMYKVTFLSNRLRHGHLCYSALMFGPEHPGERHCVEGWAYIPFRNAHISRTGKQV